MEARYRALPSNPRLAIVQTSATHLDDALQTIAMW